MAREFKNRLRDPNYYPHDSDTVGEVHQKGEGFVQGGAGTKHLDTYGPTHTAQAALGSQWARVTATQGTFRHTNGCFPDVHGHVIPFERSVNMSGGVTQPTPLAESAPDVARAVIADSTAKFETEDEIGMPNKFMTRGKDFRDRQHERWNSVSPRNRVER